MKTAIRILTIVLFAAAGSAFAQDEHNDADHTLEVERAIPAFIISGPHYRIVGPVVNRFALDEFTIETDFGTMEAIGQLQLRMRLREIQAIAAIRETNNSEIAKGSVLREGKKTVSAVAAVGKHPIKSAKGIAGGLAQRFKKFSRNVVEDVQIAASKRSGVEKRALLAKRWLGVEDSRRRIARDMNIDPYTTNPVLNEDLELLSRAYATANIGTKLLMPKIPIASVMTDVHKIVTTYDYRELIAYNRKRLIALGANSKDVDFFLDSPAFNPTAASLVIELILALDGARGQLALFDQALMTDNEVDGLFFIECLAMAAWYHNSTAPLQQMLLTTGLPAGRTESGEVIVFAATDFPHWTHLQSDIVAQLDAEYKLLSPNPRLMLAGNASGNFKQHVADLDWNLTINVRNEYLPLLPWAMRDEELQAGN